jgi:hypothetical protein
MSTTVTSIRSNTVLSPALPIGRIRRFIDTCGMAGFPGSGAVRVRRMHVDLGSGSRKTLESRRCRGASLRFCFEP